MILLVSLSYNVCLLNSTLIQVDELQNTIEDEQKNAVDELRAALEEQKTSVEEDSGPGSEAMAVD